MKKIACLTSFMVLVISSLCFADTIHVPGDQPTIQDGIDVASNGDTVLVAPGTYVENIDFLGKAITVKSSHGAEMTVIDGGNPANPDNGSVVYFQSNEGADSVLEGFLITNGTGTLFEYFPTWWFYRGGGILCDNSSPTLTNNKIIGNMADLGGGIRCRDSSPFITNNTITGNKGVMWGGGISSTDSSLTIKSSVVSGNLAGEGGGIYSGSSDMTVENCIISKNRAHSGGGIFCYFGSTISLTNNTIFENRGHNAGGIFCLPSSFIDVGNTIIWNNDWPEIWLENGPEASIFTINYSDIKGGISSVIMEGTNWALNWGPGMIHEDPLFVDPDMGDFHIHSNSPCRYSGDNSIPGLPELDFEGDPRIWQSVVDIGADEFCPHLYCTGDFSPGSSIVGKLVGLPGTAPAGLLLGSGVLDPPVSHMWGDFYLESPWLLIPLNPIPSNGVLQVATRLPAIPAPYDIPMQALIGWELSNLFVIEVR